MEILREQYLPVNTENQPMKTMESSQLQLWSYHAQTISYLQTREVPNDFSTFTNPENNGYSMNDVQSDAKVDYVIFGCAGVKPTPSVNDIPHGQRKLPRLTRIKQPSLTSLQMSILVQKPQDGDGEHTLKDVLQPKSQAHFSKKRDNDTNDCEIIGLKRPLLPPLKKIDKKTTSLPPLTKIVPVQQSPQRGEVNDFVPQKNMLSDCATNRKEMNSLENLNRSDNSFINQQMLQKSKRIGRHGKNRQISFELIDSSFSCDPSPNDLKKSPGGMDLNKKVKHKSLTTLHSSINQDKYFICSGCYHNQQLMNNDIYQTEFMKNPLQYCRKCTYSVYKMWNLKRQLNIEHSIFECQPQFKINSVTYLYFENNEDLPKRVLATSFFKKDRNSLAAAINIFCAKKTVHNERSHTIFGYPKKKMKIYEKREEYQCTECGYRSRYSHHYKMHLKCHNFGKNKKKPKRMSPIKIHKNSNIYSAERVDDFENKITSNQILPRKVKICKKKNNRTRKKRESVTLRTEKKETCTLCDYETYSLPELLSHLRSHVQYEFDTGNNVEKITSPTITPTITISTNSDNVKSGIEKLNQSEFLSNLQLDSSIKNTKSTKYQEKNSTLMDKDHSNKVNTGENKIDEMAVSINNKHANDDSVFDNLIAFPKKRKRDTNELNRNTTDEENLNFSDTEISNAVCNNYSDDVTTDEFEDQDDYSLRESPKKRLIINEKTCSHMTKTADLCTLDYSDENDLPDLPITSNKVVEYVFTSVNSPQYNTNYSNFESQINIPELSNVDRTENKIEDSSCPECSACFKNPWNYQRHIKRSHKGCKDCSQAKICAYRSSNTHPELITTTKPFECSECQYVCTSKGNFKRHMLNHSIEKQLECNICGYRCTGGGQLHRHMFVHKGGGKHFDFWPLSNMY